MGDTGEMAQDAQGAAAGERDATSGEAQENVISHVAVILPAGIQSSDGVAPATSYGDSVGFRLACLRAVASGGAG